MSLSKLSGDDNMKWYIGLALGGAVVIGGVAYYMTKQHKPEEIPVAKNITEEKSPPIPKISPKVPQRPEDAAAEKKGLGNKFFKEGKYEEALKYYDEAIGLFPSTATESLSRVYQNKAATYEQLKSPDSVIENCSKALALDPKYVKAYSRRGKAYELKKNFHQSLEDFTASIILEAFNNQATMICIDRVIKILGEQGANEIVANRKPQLGSRFYIESFFNSFCKDPVNDFMENNFDEENTEEELCKKGFVKAIDSLVSKKYDEVIGFCNNELQNKDSTYKIEALILRGSMHLMSHDHKACCKDFDEVLEESDDTMMKVNALIKKATSYLHLMNQEKAVELLQEANQLEPNHPDVLHHRGQLWIMAGQMALSKADCKRAIQIEPNFAQAVCQDVHNDYREITEKYDRTTNPSDAIKLDPKMAGIRKRFEEIVSKFPDCVEGVISYGQVLMDCGDFDEAERLHKTQLSLLPEPNPTILLHQGILKLQRDSDLKGAAELMKKALSIDPCYEAAYENLATMEVQTGNLSKGIEYFEKAIQVANTKAELTHLVSMKVAAEAQLKAVQNLKIVIPTPPEF